MKIGLRLRGDWKGLRKLPYVIENAADKAAYWVALEGENALRKQLSSNGSMATSRTLNSIDAPRRVKKAHYQIGPTTKHAYFIEHGRKKGKAPPHQAIKDWLKVKKGTGFKGRSEDQMAYLVAFKIGRDGVKAKPFIRPVVDNKNWQGDYQRLFNTAIRRQS